MTSFRAMHRGGNRRGFALLLALWMTIILSLLVYSLLYQTTSQVRITSLRKKQVQAEALAQAGIARTIVDMKNDMIFDDADGGDRFDGEGDVWNQTGRLDKRDRELAEGGSFEVEVTDLDGLFDLQQMTAPRYPLLVQIITDIGYNDDDAKATAAAIVDWTSQSTISIAEGAIGDKGRYYARLLAQSNGQRLSDRQEVTPIKTPNEPFQSVEQLLTVYGVTAELYFGPGSEEAEYFAEKTATGTAGGRFRIEKARRPARGERVMGLRDYFTVGNQGRLNLNTAPEHILAAFFGAGGIVDGRRTAESVVRRRRGGRRENVDNSGAYKTVIEVQEDGDLWTALQSAAPYYGFDIRSDNFRIRSTGVIGDVRRVLTADVRREMLNLIREESFERNDRSRERSARLSSRSERRRDKENEQLVRQPIVRVIAWRE